MQHLWQPTGGSEGYVEMSTCGEIVEVHSVQSIMMGISQHLGRL